MSHTYMRQNIQLKLEFCNYLSSPKATQYLQEVWQNLNLTTKLLHQLASTIVCKQVHAYGTDFFSVIPTPILFDYKTDSRVSIRHITTITSASTTSTTTTAAANNHKSHSSFADSKQEQCKIKEA